ncbi:NAD(P)H-dependent flavin oxidoreductase [Bacillus sp. 1P06AnD]|uniref:NAD(P)H-dependent flavin oxidoreductase n=1 Tax=Bacillus sp. 1P06AnD TaxID=3132208 RepID=UPI0039A04F3A
MKNLTEMLNIKYPIIQGGMGNISNAALASAVSEAGGLGTIGCGTMHPDDVDKIILELKARTDKPFALNIALGVTPYTTELIGLVSKHSIPVVSLSAGNPGPYVSRLHEHGATVMAVVASVKHAVNAEKAGVDLLVAEGYEAAGINSNLELTTFTLIPQIVDASPLPVIAAGGIGDGRGLAAALMLGAKGVQMGTRFIATKDAPFHDTYKKIVMGASGEETVIVGRSVGRVRRILKNPYAKTLLNAEKQGIAAEEFNRLTTEEQHILGALKGDMENGFLNGGQISGLIKDQPTVAQLIEGMMKEARRSLSEATNTLDSGF